MARIMLNLETNAILVVGFLVFLIHMFKDFCDVTSEFPSTLLLGDDIEYVDRSYLQLQYISIYLHAHQMVSNFSFLGMELGHWVKPCSTTWFSIFVVTEFDDVRWKHNFHMSKYTSMFDIAH